MTTTNWYFQKPVTWRTLQTVTSSRRVNWATVSSVAPVQATINWRTGKPFQGKILIAGSDRWQQAQ